MTGRLLDFSVIIPTYGRPKELRSCLEALGRLKYPRDRFEVIVVDDGSHEPLDDVVLPFYEQLKLMLHVQSNAGPATARNVGASIARGEYLAFTDDDCAPEPDWLTVLSNRFDSAPDAMIGGQTINALSRNLCAEASQLLVTYLYEHYNAGENGPQFFTSNNFAMPARIFKEMGGFDASFPKAAAEDREFCDRWRHLGHPMFYEPGARVLHFHAMTFGTFWRQHLNYGRGAFRFHDMRAGRHEEPIRVEPLSFYFNLLWFPFLNSTTWKAPWIAALIFVSQVANAAGFFWERKFAKKESR